MADPWELINHPLTDETGLVLAAQMKRQNDILAGIAAGTACSGLGSGQYAKREFCQSQTAAGAESLL